MKTYYTVDQISEMLNMHPKTIQKYIREGKLKATKFGKSWRVTGDDLSMFTECEKKSINSMFENETKPMKSRVMVSAVVDIDVYEREEGIRIANMLTAAMNSKPSEYGKSTLNAQFIEEESKLRIMLWGNIGFMENMMSSILMMTD